MKIKIKCQESNEQSLQQIQPVASQSESVDTVMFFWFSYAAIKTTKLLILGAQFQKVPNFYKGN